MKIDIKNNQLVTIKITIDQEVRVYYLLLEVVNDVIINKVERKVLVGIVRHPILRDIRSEFLSATMFY